jgi:hypothetical protein
MTYVQVLDFQVIRIGQQVTLDGKWRIAPRYVSYCECVTAVIPVLDVRLRGRRGGGQRSGAWSGEFRSLNS